MNVTAFLSDRKIWRKDDFRGRPSLEKGAIKIASYVPPEFYFLASKMVKGKT